MELGIKYRTGESMINIKTSACLVLLAVFLLVPACSESRAAAGDTPGVGFNMIMTAPGRNPVEFTGLAMEDNIRLEGVIGGIETVTLLADGTLYSLTPAIKTFSELDNPPPPSMNSSGWTDWLIEPGRINPLTFAGLIGEDSDVDGRISAGNDDGVEFAFDSGRLTSVRFPGARGNGVVSYTYSDFETDADISGADFRIPDDYTSLE